MAERRDQEAIVEDYLAARDRNDHQAMRRHQNEETCLILLALIGRLAGEPASFVHGIALKGGILMAGELRSPRSSADIDASTAHLHRIDGAGIVNDLRKAGRPVGLRIDGEPERSQGGMIVPFRFDSRTDGGRAKLDISVREDLVLAVREAHFDVEDRGIPAFSVPAVARAELVAEKIRTLVQRAPPRDLYDLHFYLVESGWSIKPADLRRAIDAKLSITRHLRWRPELWRTNLAGIEAVWETTLSAWLEPRHLPSFDAVVDEVTRRLRALRVDRR